MIIDFSQGKLIVMSDEVQIRLADATLYAMAEDIQFRTDVLIMYADAGAVRWSIKLDSLAQLSLIKDTLMS
ncbi:DUF3389 family protein [Shewanella surugensis]|uniref:DUF3389 domain-containing protein n=1 Tax=Shewanella surugensis TaxID=212020 RepID=A0ABT0LFW2_9GAMM|nr:DUF3389 family protein [Shewanella surugensis]MCL1126360.1 DUF3389 domain-containing protein [Shewanella surugensis]